MFILTDIRVMLRETAPSHSFSPAQKEAALALLDSLEGKVQILRREILP